MLSRDNKTPAVVCAICGQPALWMVWESDLCATCHASWFADARFAAGVIYAALGLEDEETTTPEAEAAYCAEATKRTRGWVMESKKARAA